MKIGFHTDTFNSAYWNFDKCIECEGAGGPMIEKSIAWVRSTLRELGIREDGA